LSGATIPTRVTPSFRRPMDRCEQLFRRAQSSAAGLRLEEACQLAECYGFVLARQRGSHRIYKRSATRQVVNLQSVRGMAKAYQVRQLLRMIEGLVDDLEGGFR
jgi:predicted RNA binding protein YcfA (HicA-like mRNA interferase family)